MSKKKRIWTYFCAMYGHDQNIGSPEKFCLCDVKHFRSFIKKWIDQAKKKPILSIQGVKKLAKIAFY